MSSVAVAAVPIALLKVPSSFFDSFSVSVLVGAYRRSDKEVFCPVGLGTRSASLPGSVSFTLQLHFQRRFEFTLRLSSKVSWSEIAHSTML